MNGKYNQPTAHMLQPVKGWDSMAHLDFVAPIAPTVEDALPGTVMHLNSFGMLEPGLTAQGMGMYLFYKMWDEDVQPYPLTADGTQMTAVGMQSFGGYNSEVYLRTWDSTDPYNTNGHASNVGAYQFDKNTGAGVNAKVKASQSAHTTYPAICGMELSSTEFAAQTGAGTNIQYDVNDTLTSPLPATYNSAKPGTAAQQAAGGFLKKGACYIDPICGIVSKKPVINEHGYKQICFWSTWLPALTKNVNKFQNNATLKVVTGTEGTDFEMDVVGATVTFFNNFAVKYAKDDAVLATITAAQTETLSTTADQKFVFTFQETSVGYNISDITFSFTENSVTYNVGDTSATGVTLTKQNPYTIEVNIPTLATRSNAVVVKATYAGTATNLVTVSAG